MGKGIVCSTIYQNSYVCINNTVISTNLIPLDIGHFDIIFEMDWLSKNGATINCPDRCIIFKNLEQKDVQFEEKNVITPPYFVFMVHAQ